MSFIFECGDVVVWSPALRVGEAYLGMAHGLAGVLEIPAGLTLMGR
jgi:hypothetical protein